jgi:Flp pilus assembly protein TadG
MAERLHADGERGAVLVEFAFVMPILVMFLFGIVSAGMAWNNNMALAQGARVGGRYAATLPTHNYTSMDDFLDAVAARVVSASEGSLATTATGRLVCVAYVSGGTATLDKTRRRNESGTTVTRSDSACFSDGQASTERRVQVMTEVSLPFNVGIWSRMVTLHQQLTFRYEVSDGL